MKLVPALNEVQYRPLVLNYARVAILCERAYLHLKEGTLIDQSGELRASLDRYRNLVKELRNCARELGLSPSTATLLAKPVQFLDLESMRADAEEPEQ
jgi:phage terminase small subunit